MENFKEGDQVVYIDDSNDLHGSIKYITINNVYTVIFTHKTDIDHVIWVVNDNAQETYYTQERFITLMEYRSKTIEGILR